MPGAADHILEAIEKITVPSNIFKKYPHYCIDIIQTLITLPLEKLSKKDLEISYSIMVNEFYKIERELSSSIYHIYIFKTIVDSARKVKQMYDGGSNSRAAAVRLFKTDILDIIRSVAEFCIPKTLHYEKLLCSLYCFANASQRILHDVIEIKNSETKEQYDELSLTTVEQIYGAIETNISHNYQYDRLTIVNIYNSHMETTSSLSNLPSELIEILNSTHPLLQGSVLFEYSNHIGSAPESKKNRKVKSSKHRSHSVDIASDSATDCTCSD